MPKYRYSRQYIYNLRSELYWCRERMREAEDPEDKAAYAQRCEMIMEKLGADLLPTRATRSRDAVVEMEREVQDADSQLSKIEEQLKLLVREKSEPTDVHPNGS